MRFTIRFLVFLHRSQFNAHSVKLEKILNGLKTLTPREHEVLDRVVSGRLNKQIAYELGITIRTVKAHRGRVMEKMEANSLAELVMMIASVRLQENHGDDSSDTDRWRLSHTKPNLA